MRSLHVAAMPFPTQQGTQAAVHAMIDALRTSGHEAELLCYAHGAGDAPPPSYPVYRTPSTLSGSSLRSGPSVRKLALDVMLTRKLRQLVVAREPAWVFAHHVEAALACLAARIPRFVFVAHTGLSAELAYYFAAPLRGACRRAGALLDALLCARAAHTFAVSPLLARTLREESGAPVHALRLPWPLPPATREGERAAARRALGLEPEHEVVLYAGNLDAYQGLPLLIASLQRLATQRPALRFLLATQAPARRFLAQYLPRVATRVVALADERDRWRVHAAADVVAVPRACAGGLPIKLLDALARGARVVALRRAAAGLQLDEVCDLVRDDDPEAFAAALAARLDARSPVPSRAARNYIAREHAPAAFLADLRAGLAGFA